MEAVEMENPEVEKESTTLSMVVGKPESVSELSPIYRVGEFPWRLRLYKRDDGQCELLVRCEKSMEAELWKCIVNLEYEDDYETAFIESWDKNSQEQRIGVYPMFPEGTIIDVKIVIMREERFECRTTLDLFAPRDGILVVEGKKIYVNKESLASQSPYFDRLFNANFKEKNMTEIPIGEVLHEEFISLMRMIYGENGGSVVETLLTRENVHRILQLADRFEIKIVEDGVVNVLVSNPSHFSIHEALLIADQYNLGWCKDFLINRRYSDAAILRELTESPQYDQLSNDTKKALLKKSCRIIEELTSDFFSISF